MEPEPWRCAAAARERNDPMVATAPPAAGWLLIEGHGRWARDAVVSELGARVAAAVRTNADARGWRVVAVRRPDRAQPADPVRWWVARPGARIRSGLAPEPAQVSTAPFDDDAGSAVDGPLYLVCAHGRHDVCCALRGRPLVAALRAQVGDRAFECSHLGGDRFAANAVVLPAGAVYGQVEGAEATELVAHSERGEVLSARLRGFGHRAPVVQAAQDWARRHLGDLRNEAWPPTSVRQEDPGHWRVTLDAADGRRVQVEVERVLRPPAVLTCASDRPSVAAQLLAARGSVSPVPAAR